MSIDKHKSKVSVIIVTHDSGKFFPRVIDTLHDQTVRPDEIIIIDNASTSPTYLAPYIAEDPFKVFVTDENLGFCRANNMGMEFVEPDTDFIFFLNPDAFLFPDFIENAVEYMNRPENAQCGALTGLTYGYDIEEDKPTGKYDTTGLCRTWYGRWHDRLQAETVSNEHQLDEEEIEGICGAVFFARKEAVEQVKNRRGDVFDSSFYMYKDDIDLSIRFRKKGWKLMFLPSLRAYHCRGWHTDRNKVSRLLRLCSAENEWKIQWRQKSPIGLFYSSAKYLAVKFFDL